MLTQTYRHAPSSCLPIHDNDLSLHDTQGSMYSFARPPSGAMGTNINEVKRRLVMSHYFCPLKVFSSRIVSYQGRLTCKRARIFNPEILLESKHKLAVSIFILRNVSGPYFNRAEDEVFISGS